MREKPIRYPARKSLPPLANKVLGFVGGLDEAAYVTMNALIQGRLGGTLAYGDANSITANAFRLDPSDVNGWDLPTKMTIGLPLVPEAGAYNMASIAAGSLDVQYDQAAQNLVPFVDRIITARIGWECNGDWYPWSPGNPYSTNATAANYIACFRRYALALRKWVPQVVIEWNVNHDKVLNEAFYPGDDVVDCVAIDAYLNSAFAADSFTPFLTAPSGLNWLESFGDRHDKLIAIGEWATNYNSAGYINGMGDWFRRHPELLYHGYWNGDPGTFNGILSTKPLASAAYVANFGSAAPT